MWTWITWYRLECFRQTDTHLRLDTQSSGLGLGLELAGLDLGINLELHSHSLQYGYDFLRTKQWIYPTFAHTVDNMSHKAAGLLYLTKKINQTETQANRMPKMQECHLSQSLSCNKNQHSHSVKAVIILDQRYKCEAHLQEQNQREERELNLPVSWRPFWLVRLKSTCFGILPWFHAFESSCGLRTAL